MPRPQEPGDLPAPRPLERHRREEEARGTPRPLCVFGAVSWRGRKRLNDVDEVLHEAESKA